MSIVTRRGDKGRTCLFLGGMVKKDSPRIELVGDLDELCSFIGLAKSLVKNRHIKKRLESIQKDLFCIGKEAVTDMQFLKRLQKRMKMDDVENLEKTIKTLEEKFESKKFCFTLPGKSRLSSCLDVSRSIARRAERRAVRLKNRGLLKSRAILIYLNRLSDLLYLLARECEHK